MEIQYILQSELEKIMDFNMFKVRSMIMNADTNGVTSTSSDDKELLDRGVHTQNKIRRVIAIHKCSFGLYVGSWTPAQYTKKWR